MERVIKLFKELGYSKEETEHILDTERIQKMKPETLIKNVERNYKFLIELGYSKEEVIKMTKRLPTIFGYSIENMQEKRAQMQELGYSKEEVIKMTKSLPSIFSLSIENMQEKIEYMQELGYSKEEVLKMTKSFPAILGFSIENMQEKIEFYNSIGLHSLAVKSPKTLMQSTTLSYARYMFYRDMDIDINETNYSKLFMCQLNFEKQYGISKKELLDKYDYKKQKLQKDTQQLGKETLEEQKDIEYIDATQKVIEQQEKNMNLMHDTIKE